MTLFTPTFALPYPSATDAPCDFAEQWCEFTNAFNTVASAFQTTIDRTVPVVPLARMELTSPLPVVDGDNIRFDTLSVNTAAWVDFDADPAGITINQAGRFMAVATAHIQPSPVVTGNYVGINISSTSGIVGTSGSDQIRDRQLGVMGVSVSWLVTVTTPSRFAVICEQDGATLVQPTFNAATFAMWWHADTATP